MFEYLQMFIMHILKIISAIAETGIPEIPLEALPTMTLETIQFYLTRVIPMYLAVFFFS